MNNIKFTLTRDKADALCTLLSMLHQGSPLDGLYRALMQQLASRPYHYRIVSTMSRHSIHKAPMLTMLDKRSGADMGLFEEWESEDGDS